MKKEKKNAEEMDVWIGHWMWLNSEYAIWIRAPKQRLLCYIFPMEKSKREAKERRKVTTRKKRASSEDIIIRRTKINTARWVYNTYMTEFLTYLYKWGLCTLGNSLSLTDFVMCTNISEYIPSCHAIYSCRHILPPLHADQTSTCTYVSERWAMGTEKKKSK